MKVNALSKAELAYRLNGDGLRLRTGPFVFSLRSSFDAVAAGIERLYENFPVADDETFADFHIAIRYAKGLRRIIRPQSVFEFDGLVPFKPLAARQAFALLEWGMNWCIYSHAHSFLIIHGAVLERSGQGLILPAPSGSGKSTLCAAMMNRGWRLLSDELILIDPISGLITPLGRPVSLKNRSIDVLREFSPQATITAPIHDTAKGSIAHMKPTMESVLRVDEAVLPRWIVFPCYTSGSATHLQQLEKADTFMRLIDNAFNYSILRERGFETVAAIVNRVDSFTAQYSDLEDVIRRIDCMHDDARTQ